MRWRKKIKIPIKILLLLTVIVLLTGGTPVFAFNMESKNYKMELESSDIKAIAQNYERSENLAVAGISLPKKETVDVLKSLIIVFVVLFLSVWIVVRVRKDFEIKRKNL